jgi:hypothetical protein
VSPHGLHVARSKNMGVDGMDGPSHPTGGGSGCLPSGNHRIYPGYPIVVPTTPYFLSLSESPLALIWRTKCVGDPGQEMP